MRRVGEIDWKVDPGRVGCCRCVDIDLDPQPRAGVDQ
jgi:hypothetical protein